MQPLNFSEAVVRMCSVEKMFLKFLQNSQEKSEISLQSQKPMQTNQSLLNIFYSKRKLSKMCYSFRLNQGLFFFIIEWLIAFLLWIFAPSKPPDRFQAPRKANIWKISTENFRKHFDGKTARKFLLQIFSFVGCNDFMLM